MTHASPVSTLASSGAPYSDDEIRRRIDACPKLASLQSVNKDLARVVNSERSYTAQIAEVIRRDPSLTARLLRMVNSVFFGLSAKVNDIEEAVLFLGIRQIRELSMATPVIEDMQRIGESQLGLPWRELWKHCIGSGIMTREILSTTTLSIDDDMDYIIGLLHNVGKVVLASTFPNEFAEIVQLGCASTAEVCQAERNLVGWDHAQIGGYYLQRHQLSNAVVEAVRHHNDPQSAPEHAFCAAAVQVADQLVRQAGIRGGFENVPALAPDQWERLPGWHILYGQGERASRLARAALSNSVQRLPFLLSGMI